MQAVGSHPSRSGGADLERRTLELTQDPRELPVLSAGAGVHLGQAAGSVAEALDLAADALEPFKNNANRGKATYLEGCLISYMTNETEPAERKRLKNEKKAQYTENVTNLIHPR